MYQHTHTEKLYSILQLVDDSGYNKKTIRNEINTSVTR